MNNRFTTPPLRSFDKVRANGLCDLHCYEIQHNDRQKLQHMKCLPRKESLDFGILSDDPIGGY